MHYNFIEIGTSDFRTIIENCSDNEIGLSIEPIKLYLDNLPNKKNVTKINCAISDKIGEMVIYYVNPNDIIKYKLPNWVRGCNSINKPHPTVLNLLGEEHDEIITKEIVPVLDWVSLIEKYNIESMDLLKIDTEGHDGIILENYYQSCLKNEKLLSKIILFENNILRNVDLNNIVISNFLKIGYNGYQIGDDYKLIKI